jgi:hypothetical protein
MLVPAAITLHYDMPTFSEMYVSLAIPLRSHFRTGTVSTPHTSGNCASPDWAHPHELSTCSATLIWPTTHCPLSAKFAIPATLKLSTMLTQCVFEPLIRNAFRWSALATVLMVYISSTCLTLPRHHAQRGMTLTYLRRLTWLLPSFTMSLMRN